MQFTIMWWDNVDVEDCYGMTSCLFAMVNEVDVDVIVVMRANDDVVGWMIIQILGISIHRLFSI